MQFPREFPAVPNPSAEGTGAPGSLLVPCSSAPLLITWLRDRYVAGPDDFGAVVGPLWSALVHPFACDAHIQCGFAADSKRITWRSLRQGPITMTAIAFDFDPPGHEPDVVWNEATAAKLEALIGERAGFAYATRAGWRYVAALSAPEELRSPEDWKGWRARYKAACAELEVRWGLAADRACSEPGRLFRLGFVVREGVRLTPSTIGNPEALGSFELPAVPDLSVAVPTSPADEAVARRAAAMAAPAGNVGEAPHTAGVPLGELYRLCRRRRLIIGRSLRGGLIISCPNRAKHTIGSASDGSTILYPADRASGTGHIHCMHSACAELTTEDWLALLGAPRLRRVVRILRAFELGDAGDTKPTADTIERIRLELTPIDGLGLVFPPEPGYPMPPATKPTIVDVAIPREGGSEAVRVRFDSLWVAAEVTAPKDLDPAGDLAGAIDELRGKVIELELADGALRRLLPRKERAA